MRRFAAGARWNRPRPLYYFIFFVGTEQTTSGSAMRRPEK